MTAGPTPVPPAVSQAMATPMLYHRAPAFVELYERVLRKLPAVFRTSNEVLTFAASGTGGARVGRREPRPPGHEDARLRRRQVRRALDRARGGLRRRARALRAGLGRASGRGGDRAAARRERRDRGRLRHVERDLDRHRARRPGDRRGRQPPRRDPRGRRRLGPRRGRAAPGRVGDRRGRRRLAEGADVPARARLRLGLAARARLGRSEAGRPLLLRLGPHGQQPAQGRQPVHAGRRAVPGARRRARPDRGGGPRQRHGAPPAARARHARRAPPVSASICSAIPTSARRSSPRSSCRTRSTAPRSRARCARWASPPTVARTSSRAASCASRTAATSARSTSSRRWRAWRWSSSSSATTSTSAPASPLRSACSSRRACPPQPDPQLLHQQYRILVKEKIADSGVDLLREQFDVDLGLDWSDEQLAERIGDYHGILIRSATRLTADLIERADNLRVIGRAGIGVDNVDVGAATKRGIIVANAPQSNIIAAAEHTVALMLALARNIPQAHGSLTSGKWERSKFGGVEVYEKTLGILGFGRIGQLVADRARARSGCTCSRSTRTWAPSASASSAPSAPRRARRALRAGGLHHRAPAQDARHARLAGRRGVRPDARRRAGHQLRARRADRRRRARRTPWTPARSRAPRSTSSRPSRSPSTRCSATPTSSSRRTSAPRPTEAQDRAGVQTAEQVVAALTGGVVSTAVNIPAVSAEDMEVLGPFLPLCQRLGRLGAALLEPHAVERVEIEYLGRIAERDTRLLTISALNGLLAGHTEEDVNLVNAPGDRRGARDRGLRDARRPTRATSPTSCGSRCIRPSSGRASSARRSGAITGRTCSRRGASASTCRWRTTATWRCSATATSRG